MRLRLIAVGPRQPRWVEEAFADYARRFPRGLRLELVTVPLGRRGKSGVARAVAEEGAALLSAVGDRARVVALDRRGELWDTETLAARLAQWRQSGQDLCFLIGGPDGLAPQCLARADETWSLSLLTLPHGLARVVVVESLYRAAALLEGHPYHR